MIPVLGLFMAPVALYFGGSFAFDRINDGSWSFFRTGQRIVVSLGDLAKTLRSGERAALSRFFQEEYEGAASLGLDQLRLGEEREHIRRFRFTPQDGVQDRQAVLDQWVRYIRGFESIEEVALHIHRMEEWDSPGEVVATVRFELIGVPSGTASACIDRGLFRANFALGPDSVEIRKMALVEGERIIADRPHFEDVGQASGINFVNRYFPDFLDRPLKFGMIRYGPGGISSVDYDNDGFYDLFIPDGVESKLFRNLGDGAFQDVTEETGLSGLDGVSVGVFADYDNDGFLDLYVGRYLDPRKDIPTTFYARNGEPNQLYRNDGDGSFTNVTEEAGVGELGLCLGSVFGDYNDDGLIDLYVVNDFGRNTLYRNDGDGSFTDFTVKTNTLAYGAGMNASFVDYDNDGALDIYVSNIRSEHAWYAEAPTVQRYMLNCFTQGVWMTDSLLYFEIFRQSGFQFVDVFQQMASGNTLLRNVGNGTFEDVTWASAANPPGWFWGVSFADFDNDGWQDVYAANGWVYNDRDTEIELEFLNNVVSRQKEFKTGIFFDPKYFGRRSWHGWERNRMLRNNRDGTFLEIGRPAGTDLLLNSRGVAVADYWNRGVLDIAVAASNDRHTLLKNEVGTPRNWIAVELVGTQTNRDAVGARVTLRVGDNRQMREVVLGDGYGSQNTLRLHFGLADADRADEIQVLWPRSGSTQRFESVAANQIVEIQEGRDQLIPKSYPNSRP